jgi:exoribonuclease R
LRDDAVELDLHWLTIDPGGARDLDDAIYAELRPNGSILLLVSYADAARWVSRDSEVDQFARRLGFSLYGPGIMIPLLGERLSCDEASLLAGKKRRAFTVGIEVDARGEIAATHFFRSVITVRERRSYDEMQELLSGGGRSKTREVMERVAEANRRLRLKRAAGATFMSGDSAFDSHLIIQECMINANHVIASMGIPAFYRVQTPPERRLRHKFLREVQAAGVDVAMSVFGEAVPFRRMLEDLQRRGRSDLVHDILDTYMARAAYRITNTGHKALGMDYTVFKGLRNYAGLENQRRAHMFLDGVPIRSNGEMKSLERRLNYLQRRQADYIGQLVELLDLECLRPENRQGVHHGLVRSVGRGAVLVDVPGFRRWGLVNVTPEELRQIAPGRCVNLRLEAYCPDPGRFVFQWLHA